jgi:hypothetical protein
VIAAEVFRPDLRHGGRAGDDATIGKSEPEFHLVSSHFSYPSTRLSRASLESHSARARRQAQCVSLPATKNPASPPRSAR